MARAGRSGNRQRPGVLKLNDPAPGSDGDGVGLLANSFDHEKGNH